MKNNLKRYVDDFFANLEMHEDYKNNHSYKDIFKASIDDFLDIETAYTAFSVYEMFFSIYQISTVNLSESDGNATALNEPNIILDLIRIMKKYGENSLELLEKRKNYFINSVNVFLLGLAIYSQNSKYRAIFDEYVGKSNYKIDSRFSQEEFLYRWGIASLLYDISMPVLRVGKPVKELLNKEINSIFSKYGETLNLDFLNLDKLNSISRICPSFTDKFIEANPHAKFFDLFKPTEILAFKIACDFDLDNKQQNMLANVLIDKYITGDCPCKDDVIYDSGIISSILILNIYGYLIQDNNLDSDYFFYPIVDSAEAILLHNFYGNVLQGEPFNLKELDPIRNPIAFLLILCDGIQDANKQAYGIRDRSIKNDLDILVNDDYFDVLYIVKIASTTLGFYESIKDLLEKRLLISEIFAKGLQISYDINANEEIDFEETVQNEISFGNVESLALSLYQHYVDEIRMDYDQQKGTGYIDERTEKLYHDLVPFNELPSGLKIQYIRQAKSIPKKLNSVGFEIVELSDKREAIDALTPAEVNEMAILEHKRWCDEKFALGWAYGDVRDNEKLVHDCLVPWEMLPFEMQQFDINSARNIPNVVHSAGLKIVSGKLRMLAIELYGYYQKDYGTNQDLFSDVMQLDEAVRDSYYKKSLSIVKILRNIGLDVVDADDSRVPFNLELQHIEYLAKNEYNNEYFEKINLGWQYGPVKDDARRISPSMVHWDKLDKRIQNDNMKMIEHLPEMCDNVGLKIVERH